MANKDLKLNGPVYIMKRCLCTSSLFTDKEDKLLLTQVASPRYSVQNDGVLSLLFEPCEYFRIESQTD